MKPIHLLGTLIQRGGRFGEHLLTPGALDTLSVQSIFKIYQAQDCAEALFTVEKSNSDKGNMP